MTEVAPTMPADHLPGSNHPPEPIDPPKPTALQTLQALLIEIETWRATNKKVETAEQATAAKAFVDRMRAATKASEDERKGKNAPHDAAIAANNATFKPSNDKVEKYSKTLKAENLAFMQAEQKKIDDKRRADEEATRKAAAEEERQRKAAEDLVAKGDLAGAAVASAAAESAAIESATVGYAARAEPAKVKIGGGAAGGRAMSTRTIWEAKITDPDKAAAHYAAYPEVKAALAAAVLKAADADAKSFKDKDMAPPGVEFTSREVAV